MAPTTPPFINPSLRTNGGDDGAAGALASATSAGKKQGSRAPRGPKVSNNFEAAPARRNPARGAKIDGGVAEAEAAGGSPRKQPRGPSPRKKLRGDGTFLLRLDRAKATTGRGRTEPSEPESDPEEWAEGGRPRKAPPKTTKPPPITQEYDGEGDLASEEEELDEDNGDDEELDANGIASRDEARRFVESRAARPKGAKRDEGANEGGRPKEDDSEEIAAVRDGATRKAIPASPRGTSSRRFVESLAARPRGAKRDDGANDGGRPKEDDSEETAAGRDGATRKAIPASPRGTKRDGGKNDRTDGGGRPKNYLKELDAGDIGDLDDDDEDPDYGDIEDDEGPEDEGKTAPVKDRAQVAAGGAAARRWTEDVAVRARAALAYQPRGRPPSNVVRPDQPYDVAARALAALRDYGPDRNPRVVQDYGMESDEEANSKATPPPSVDGGVWVDDDARGGQSRGQNQVSAGLFDSSEVFVSTAVGKTQGKTGQRGSAADFLPGTAAGGDLKGGTGQGGSAADFFPDEDSAPFEWVAEADHKAMRALADNRSFRGTSASRMAADTRAAEAAPGWTGAGTDYAAWLRDLRGNPTNPDAVITDRAPERAYLVVMNRGQHVSVIHHLFRWKAPEGGRSRIDGRIVAFEGEVLDGHGLPRLWSFAEDEERLLDFRPLSVEALEYAARFYRDGDRDDVFHDRHTLPLGVRGATVQTCQRLIPIPVGWAHMFLDNPPMGVAYRRMLQLMTAAADTAADRRIFRAFGDGVALACGSPDPTALNPVSAAHSTWKRVAYSKATLSVATAAWEGHQPGASKPPPPRTASQPPTRFDDLFGGPAREEDGNEGWGDSWGYCRPNTPPTDAGTHHTAAPEPTPVAPVPGGLDLAALISTILKSQADAQLAQTNANHANLIAFQTATAQALAAKGGDKESKLTTAKKRILQACAGVMHADEFTAEQVYLDVDAEGGASEALGRILRKRLKPVPLSPYKTNIHITPQLIATVKTFSFSSNGDKTYAGCTKGITIFAVPWRTAEAINEDLAEDEYFEAATLKSVADIRKHVTSAKVELPTSLQGVVRVLNNYCRVLDVLFGPDCPHLTHVSAIRDGLETHEAELESRLTGVLILHLMWRVHHDARQFFLACERWEDGEQLPHSTLGNTVRQLVDDCAIQVTITCPEAMFLGPPVRVPAPATPSTPRAARVPGSQPTVNAAIPPLCQKVVATFNRLHPGMSVGELCEKGKIRFGELRVGRPGACVHFGLFGRCSGCKYRHEVCAVAPSKQAAVVKVMESALATIKAAAGA